MQSDTHTKCDDSNLNVSQTKKNFCT